MEIKLGLITLIIRFKFLKLSSFLSPSFEALSHPHAVTRSLKEKQLKKSEEIKKEKEIENVCFERIVLRNIGWNSGRRGRGHHFP